MQQPTTHLLHSGLKGLHQTKATSDHTAKPSEQDMDITHQTQREHRHTHTHTHTHVRANTHKPPRVLVLA